MENTRSHLWDFEGEAIVDDKHKVVLVTLVDRKSLEFKMKPWRRKLSVYDSVIEGNLNNRLKEM